jgi:hypothetical protein
MAKTKLEYQIQVDNREMIKKFKEVHRAAEDFSDALKVLREEIKIGIKIVPIEKKKWYQFWK